MADHDPGGPSRPPPKTKAAFVRLLDDAGIQHASNLNTDEVKRLCADHRLIPPQPPSEKQLLVEKIARHNDQQDLLGLPKLEYSGKLGAPGLKLLCEEHGLLAPVFKEFEEITVVKCALRKAMTVDDPQYAVFSAHIESFVNVISRMMRRTTLVLSYHVTRLLQHGLALPDLYSTDDTYWKNWLRLGLKDGVQLDGELETTYETLRPYIDTMYSPDDAFETEQPIHFDQVLCYASRTLQTIVSNNAWVPLFARLGRLAKVVVRRWKEGGLVDADMKAFKLLTAVRSHAPAVEGWPAVAREWVASVRTKLNAEDGEYMFDKHGSDKKIFQKIAEFNYWMQLEFRKAGVRGIRLMPVVGVKRMHVRLDVKTLGLLFDHAFPDDTRVLALKAIKREHDKAVRTAANADKTEATTAAYVGCSNPADSLPRAPAKVKSACDAAQWKAQQEAQAAHKANVERIKGTPEYVAQDAKYNVYRGAQVEVASSFFGKVPVRKGWTFDASITTDGVSVSLQYSRTVMRQVSSVKKAKKVAFREEGTVATDDDYDRHAPTVLDDAVVLGIDPGRANLATVAMCFWDPDGKKQTTFKWSLSRGEYREMSGIKRTCAESAKIFACLQSSFHSLADPGSSLKAADCSEILEYMRRYSTFSRHWWEIALRRSESRRRLVGYMGKRRVLDQFFSRIKKSVSTFLPGKRIEVAYGEAGLTMSPTGKGEVAVPTAATYKACQRIFKDDPGGARTVVKVVDEYNTTKVDWETGETKELVYRVISLAEGQELDDPYGLLTGLSLGHIAGKTPPLAPARDRAVLARYKQLLKDKNKVRRGGMPGELPDRWWPPREDPLENRFPEIRSLRFCPKLCKYVDRDASAIAIARLRVMELLGRARPTPFARGR